MYKDVALLVRHCLHCAGNKGKPLVVGHQRSREYDGPFRYLIIDFVGPMNPKSARGHEFMFTCACAWSGWYWVVRGVCGARTAAQGGTGWCEAR